MDRSHPYSRFYKEVSPALKSKVEEFKIFGYEKVTELDVWGFLTKKKWKKSKEEIHMYELVADIMAVKIGELMNYTTVEAFKKADFAFEDEEERRELLK